MTSPAVLPLRDRKTDWFFVVIFSTFAFTSFAADSTNALLSPSPTSGWFMSRAVYELYALGNDPLLIANPAWMRAMCFVSTFVFGPFYLALVHAFVTGNNRIRTLALVYVGMIVESLLVILYVEFAGEGALFAQMCEGGVKSASALAAHGLNADLTVQNVGKFLAYNLPYKIVPILLAVRMRSENPFSRTF